jgi:hypothetical protein
MEYLRTDYFVIACDDEIELPDVRVFEHSAYDENLGIMKVFVDQDTLDYLRFVSCKRNHNELSERYEEYWSSRF